MFTKKKYILFSLVVLSIFVIPAFSHAATAEELITRYKNAVKTGNKVNVLVVPGHDDEYWGTEFGDVREGDITVSIGQFLYTYLKADPRLNVTITRTQEGYTDTFKTYFETNREQIQNFITTSQASFKQQVSAGTMQLNEIVPHATARPEVALRLYGINKWANENNVDLVIHLHVNDSGGRQYGEVGKYHGISMYIPDKQYSNAPVSEAFGKAIWNELIKKNTPSNYPPEVLGISPDQELIAIGAANTLKAGAALIEYGYIYEPKFLNIDNRDALTKDLAYQTYAGVQAFFGNNIHTGARSVDSYLPYTWSKDLKQGSGSKADISALQAALTKSGVYTCGITGTFGPCTTAGVKAFQKKYKISQTGLVGPQTRAKLNGLYSL